ncbi:MAG: transaldolase [Candidatus Omnitrophota bacterium]|nr:transaldolase [Candidatus Omnitrophota bacterium]
MNTKTLQKNPLKELTQFGQSPWYDNIERGLLKNGSLKELITDYGILGVTTNPSIFEKAISNSSLYDSQIRELARQGKNALEIYEELAILDVSEAADLFKDIYFASNRMDGYISIEVLPDFAHDVSKTIDCAKNIFKRINRENIMIKVPATTEGAKAISELVFQGINVNATLIFSKPHYEAVAKAYIEGLRQRQEKGLGILNIVSVASVFVSRVDTKIDLLLEEQGKSLKGKIALANAKLIYQLFKKIFSPENFEDLEKMGGKIQRLLWGSTSTKNPLYSDVKYVEELIAANTINTIPPETICAFKDHGRLRLSLEEGLQEAEKDLKGLQALGINLNSVCQEIQHAGVKAFQDSFDKLISAIKEKSIS